MSPKFDYTDSALLNLMRDDDQEAFTMLYRRYWERLFVTAVKALRGKEEAEDAVQDVFFSIWRRRKELNIKGSLEAYLQTSIRNRSIDYIEKNITCRDYLALLTDVVAHSPLATDEVQLNIKEVQETIRKAVNKMPPKMQEAYRLSREENLSYKEIAAQMDISSETVKKHIQHALQLIKTALEHKSIAVAIVLLHFIY